MAHDTKHLLRDEFVKQLNLHFRLVYWKQGLCHLTPLGYILWRYVICLGCCQKAAKISFLEDIYTLYSQLPDLTIYRHFDVFVPQNYHIVLCPYFDDFDDFCDATLSFVFALQLLLLQISLSNNVEQSIIQGPSNTFFFSKML